MIGDGLIGVIEDKVINRCMNEYKILCYIILIIKIFVIFLFKVL